MTDPDRAIWIRTPEDIAELINSLPRGGRVAHDKEARDRPGPPPARCADHPGQADLSIVRRKHRLGIRDNRLDFHDQERARRGMPAQHVNRASLAEVIERHFDRRFPAALGQQPDDAIDKGRVGCIEHPVETFAMPSNADVEIGAKCSANGFEVGQRDSTDVASLDP